MQDPLCKSDRAHQASTLSRFNPSLWSSVNVLDPCDGVTVDTDTGSYERFLFDRSTELKFGQVTSCSRIVVVRPLVLFDANVL